MGQRKIILIVAIGFYNSFVTFWIQHVAKSPRKRLYNRNTICDVSLFFSSVNGEKQDGGFDDVEGEVFPCAGSYRSGVTIRLLKVRMGRFQDCFGKIGQT